jgi:hypothetical protein
MSLRLDPRRLGYLKQQAAEAGMRPGDLVRQWVEERIDAQRGGAPGAAPSGLADRFAELVGRVTALEIAAGIVEAPVQEPVPAAVEEPPAVLEEPTVATEEPAADDGVASDETPEQAAEAPPETPEQKPTRTRKKRVAASPRERVALHDEMIAVIRERGPMTAGDLAVAINERGRYAPPRSGKPLDAAMVSQRVSNPTYRSRFTRDGGRIGLAEIEGT